jgi:hypothetical protein
MGIAEMVFAILSASATALGSVGGLLWWVYRRGQASGADRARREAGQRTQAEADARIQALEKLIAETRVELASLQPKRRRALARRNSAWRFTARCDLACAYIAMCMGIRIGTGRHFVVIRPESGFPAAGQPGSSVCTAWTTTELPGFTQGGDRGRLLCARRLPDGMRAGWPALVAGDVPYPSADRCLPLPRAALFVAQLACGCPPTGRRIVPGKPACPAGALRQ